MKKAQANTYPSQCRRNIKAVERRKIELTVAMLQLVDSKRDIAILPVLTVEDYLHQDYVKAKRLTADGLTGRLYKACLPQVSEKP